MSQSNDHETIRKQFWTRQLRQFVAFLVAVTIMFVLGYLYQRTDLLGDRPKETAFALLAIVIAAFIGFSAMNWRCPICGKYLGADINRRVCRKCGIKLQ